MAEKLVHYTCEICGESLELSADRLSAKCKFCGTEYYFKEDNSQDLVIPLNRANEDRRRCDFYDAIKGYKSILTEYPNNAEANWGLVLSTYGIEYVQDTRTQKYIPTCHRVVEESILNHPNYLEALKNAAPEQVKIFETKAKQIDKLQKSIKFKMEDEEEFEVFISFKSKDEKGIPTPDSVIGRRIRDELENRGIKTFFSDVTLEDRMGDEYEPIIYKALHTCKAFILIGTSKANINAPWVKNEWSRFEERIEKEHLTTGTWFAVFDKIKASDFPSFFSTQGFDLRNYPVGYEIKIADAIALKLGKSKKVDESAELKKQLQELQEQQRAREEEFLEQQRKLQEQMKTISSKPQGDTNVATLIAPLIKRMFLYLEEGDFVNAIKYTEKVLDLDPENGEAYLGKLLAENKVAKLEDLKNCEKPFDNSMAFKNTMRFCNENTQQKLAEYLNVIKHSFSINDVKVKQGQSVKITPKFVDEKIASDITYTYQGDNVILENDIVTGLISNTKSVIKATNGVKTILFEVEVLQEEHTQSLIFERVADSYEVKGVSNTQESKIIIPNFYNNLPVTKINACAFENCNKLTSIKLPNSVTSIGYSAFDDCDSLTSVNYTGTIDQWIQIEFGDSYANPMLYAKKLYINGELVASVNIQTATKINDYAFSYCACLTSVTIGNSVTSIGDRAFVQCDSLTSVTIGNSVTSIGEDAFNDCRSLTSITIGNSVTSIGDRAFVHCDSLTSVTIPDSVTSIGSFAFSCCTSLTSVTIPNSVTSIGDDAFRNCRSLKSVAIPNSVTSIGFEAFEYCSSLTSVTIGNSVTSIGNSTFSSCTSLTSVTIPNTVKSIGNSAFYNCPIETATMPTNAISCIPKTKLKNVIINGGTSIGSSAFFNCSSLTSVTIPNSVTSIGEDAFYNCSSLKSVTIPNSVTSIGSFAFNCCTSLTSVTIGENVTSIGNATFYKCTSLTSVNYTGAIDQWVQIEFEDYFANPLYHAKKLYINGALVTSANITTATKINDYAFYNCTSLTSVTIGDGVTSIGKDVFGGCDSLTSVTIGDGVTSIGEDAFVCCASLTSVNYLGTIDQWVQIEFASYANALFCVGKLYINGELVTSANITTATKINDNAFYGCTSLTSVTIGNSVTSIGSDAFSSCTSLTSVTIGNSVTSIGDDAFVYCPSLTSVNYLGTIDQWVQIEFVNNYANPLNYAKKLYINGELVTNANITTATKINDYAFYGCTSLTSVTIPNSVTSIGEEAFSCLGKCTINFNGTKKEWKAITKEKGWNTRSKIKVKCLKK